MTCKGTEYMAHVYTYFTLAYITQKKDLLSWKFGETEYAELVICNSNLPCHPFLRYLLRTYCVPGLLQDAKDSTVNKTDNCLQSVCPSKSNCLRTNHISISDSKCKMASIAILYIAIA